MVRRELIEAYRLAKEKHSDPVKAWDTVVADKTISDTNHLKTKNFMLLSRPLKSVL